MSNTYYNSPVGTLEITGNQEVISSVSFLGNDPVSIKNSNELLNNCVQQLREYFEGTRETFDLPLAPQGSHFQRRVWKTLQEIPFGKTISYLDLAIMMGDKNATRAVGNVNGKNPIPIIIPCHRVVGSDGSLTGYAGGLCRKEWLIAFEKKAHQGKLF